MIRVEYIGRMGNQLFQYCFGRILAEQLGYRLQADPIPGFPGTAEEVAGVSHGGDPLELSGQLVDLPAILSAEVPRPILLKGFFQRIEYYADHHEAIRRWLHVPGYDQLRPQTRVVVHVRRKDYIRNRNALPFSYYEQAIERLRRPGERITILTDDPGDPFFRRFQRWDPVFQEGSAIEDFVLMQRAEQLVLSQSSFSWWAAVLGEAETIFSPAPAFGFWENDAGGGINLTEHPRFTCLPCLGRYRPNALEKAYIKWQRWKSVLLMEMNIRFGCSFHAPFFSSQRIYLNWKANRSAR